MKVIIIPKRNENPPENIEIYIHKLLVQPISSYFINEFLLHIELMIDILQEIKVQSLKNEVKTL